MKFKIPSSIAGSPQWFRNQLKDLLCQVDYRGMPQFFLTLTADEMTSSRWQEVGDLESILRRFKQSATWQNAPVECLRLFRSRLKKFFKDFILKPGGGLLGRIQHYIIRYEFQNRGSCHAHIILWVYPDDVEQVTNEIVAVVPGEFDHHLQSFRQPTDPLEAKLQQFVLQKQIHTCGKQKACKVDNKPCKYRFPWAVQNSHKAVFSLEKLRWTYFRPRYEDRNVVPYHPSVLLLWGAHMNLQRVTSDAWSHYLLKYALKCEPSGNFKIDAQAAKILGLHGLSETQLQAVSAYCLTKPVSPCEAAMSILEFPLVERSK